jgi:hypothetical protein
LQCNAAGDSSEKARAAARKNLVFPIRTGFPSRFTRAKKGGIREVASSSRDKSRFLMACFFQTYPGFIFEADCYGDAVNEYAKIHPVKTC